jgi:chaperonin GroES
MATDPMTGQNVGQNTKTGTMDAMIREGERVFNGIFKRTYRALKSEFRKLYRLNQIYLPDENDFDAMFAGVGAIQRKDYMYSSKIIFPAADPYMVSDTQKLQQAMALKQASMSTQGYNKYEVEKRYLTALQVQDIDQVFPDPKGPNAIPPQPHPKVQIEQMKERISSGVLEAPSR